MDDKTFDAAVIAAVFGQAALRGWPDVNIVEAARDADLPLDRVRMRFPGRGAVLLRFGAQADGAALAFGSTEPSARERLFDILMARYDALQQHRAGIVQLMRALRTDPGTSLLLYTSTLRSMKWLLEGAGIPASGLLGQVRVHGLLALWMYGLRAWETDESADLSATMAAVDRGLDRAIQAENMLPGQGGAMHEMPDEAIGENGGDVGGEVGGEVGGDLGVEPSGEPAAGPSEGMSPAEDAAAVFKDAGLLPDEPPPPATGPAPPG